MRGSRVDVLSGPRGPHPGEDVPLRAGRLIGSWLLPGVISLVACGGSSDDGGSASPGAGGASTGGASSSVGGNAGVGGAATGKGGSGASSGAAGSPGAGTGGKGGTGGTGTSGGSGASGTSGGSAGAPGGCTIDADCGVPITNPAGCAHGKCDPAAHTCTFIANDGDGDTFPTNKCKSSEGKTIVLGTDCDDSDKNTFPGAWDGPMGDGHPDRCDAVDQDCDGTADDSTTKNGTTCTCMPNDVRDCSTDSSGKPIDWPTGKPAGACKYGSQTCSAQGMWGPCTGAIAPTQEACNKIDDDCNGMVDDGPAPDNVPMDAAYFAYDGDADGHAGKPSDGYTEVHACAYAKPSTAPTACTKLALPCSIGTTVDACCPAGAWKLAAGVPQDDCDDRSPSVNPAQVELCNKVDDDCNGKVDDGPAPDFVPQDAKYFFYDGDGDDHAGSIASGYQPIHACGYAVPTDPPAACTSLALPCALGTTAAECCPSGHWKQGIPNDDCDDRNASLSPGAVEICGDNVDNNCNAQVDEGCSCTNGTTCGSAATCNLGTWTSCAAGQTGVCTGGPPQQKNSYFKDVDGDGWCDLGTKVDTCPQDAQPTTPYKLSTSCASAAVTDCNDTVATISPAAKELCGDGVDSDCDGNDSNGYNVDVPCDVKGIAVGTCAGGGSFQCTSVGSTMSACASKGAGYGNGACISVALGGSFDSDCDGQETPCTVGLYMAACPPDPQAYCDALSNCAGTYTCGPCGSGQKITCKMGPAPDFLCTPFQAKLACH